MTGILLWAAGCTAVLIALRRWLAPVFLSPIVLVGGSMLALAVLGGWLYQDVAMAPGGAGVRLIISDDLLLKTAHLLLWATSAFLVGGALGVIRQDAGRPRVGFGQITLSQPVLAGLAVVSLLPMAYTVIALGLPHLLDRPYYLAADNTGGSSGVLAFGAQLSVAAVIGCGFLAAQWRGGGRLLAVLLSVLYVGLFFSQGTRLLSLAPTLFALGAFMGAPGRRTRVWLVIAAATSVYLLRLPLFLRGQTEHGLLNYVRALPDYLTENSGWDEVALNVLVSFAIIGVTAYVQPTFPTQDLVISLNPAPGSLAGWYDIFENHRLNVYTPYGAVGELGNVGLTAVVGYFFVLGLLMAFLDRRVRRHLAVGQQGAALVIVGLVALFCLYNQQYNLRQSTRMLYYALAFEFAVILWTWFRARGRTEATGPEEDGDAPVPIAGGASEVR